MLGIFVGLLSAVSVSIFDTFIKRLSGVSPYFLVWVLATASVPVLAILVVVFGLFSVPPPAFFFLILFVMIPMELLLEYARVKALHLSPMSLVAPFSVFTSIFLIPTGFLILGELPTVVGLSGIGLVVVGSLVLVRTEGNGSLRTGLRGTLADPGVRLALLAAFLASITISVAKFSFHYAPPLLAAFYISALISLVLTPFVARSIRALFRLHPRDCVGLAFSSGIAVALNYIGLSLLPAAYFISLKRTSVIFNVLSGKVVFHEERIRERLIGALFMLSGVILIAVG